MSLQVIECPQVDLISPFPVSEAHRLRGWLYCYKSLIIDDQTSGTEDELESYLSTILASPTMISWGIIDKFNQVNSKHEAPLVGFIGYEPMGAFNGYFHVASNRSCWGKGFVDEAGRAAISAIFSTYPSVLRVSAAMLDRNKPAKALAHRLGFERDGRFEAFTQ
jgi:RimJ/RimL family protein N-acetyltransferase